jgi:4-carboxymuconolactone decarboxylase
MTRDVDVPDALMQRLAAHFDARGVVEVVATIAAYNMVSRLLVALKVAH